MFKSQVYKTCILGVVFSDFQENQKQFWHYFLTKLSEFFKHIPVSQNNTSFKLRQLFLPVTQHVVLLGEEAEDPYNRSTEE